MICALIMAGGKGERFWPLSTEKKPKQFLKLLGEETMLQMTISRLLPIMPIENIFVITGKNYSDLVSLQLPELPKENIIIEPCGRNTAPCIALSAFYINKRYKDAVMITLPADHMIEKEKEFRDTLLIASDFVEKNNEALLTIGLKANRPETGYGYIKYNKNNKKDSIEGNILKVYSFEEKPNYETAQKYIEEGNYLWNSGMFIWKTTTILKLTSKYLNKTYDILSEIASDTEHYDELLESNYKETDNISVDYGIIEKADNMYVIPANFGWDDVGSWHALERYRKKDENNNIHVGEIKNIDGNNNIILGNNKPIITVGLDNVFIVDTDDILVICKKDKIEDLKSIKKSIL